MTDKQIVIKEIRAAFSQNEYPGDDFLQGSFEGAEPNEEIKPFKGQDDWKNISSELLDIHHVALNFFSEAGLRFFLPAYLIADLQDELETADPLFILVHGFSDLSVPHPTKAQVFIRKTGKTAFVNPKRYGALTFYDYARWRLSVFNKEEAKAIVSYLKFRREAGLSDLDKEQIDAALKLYWLERTENAPSIKDLEQHLKEEAEYLAAIIAEANISTEN